MGMGLADTGSPSEVRYRLIATLLQAEGPLALDELVEQSGVPKARLLPALKKLVGEGTVVEGELVPDQPAPQFCWAERWASKVGRDATSALQKLKAIVAPAERTGERRLAIDSKPMLDFNRFIIHDYTPPKDKRLLVFFQCSVRRPFSKSPSHGSMRRAVYAATGHWPRKEFEQCPVHVVVLASTLGPVPYELEDVYPANIGGGGVKHFSDEHYEQVLPILAERMAAYVTAHRRCYDHITTFTQSRYGEVMRLASEMAGVPFPVLPVETGPIVVALGKSKPRTYWQKYWIQLTLQLIEWLGPDQQVAARQRLKKLKVKYGPGKGA
jgi:hypothetical protein